MVAFTFLNQQQYHFEVRDSETVIWFEPTVFEPAASYFVLTPNSYKEYAEV